MADKANLIVDEVTSKRLGKIRQQDTSAEQLVRHALWACGLRYRVRNRDLPGSPDVANRGQAWAVFVHGCYWHSHEGCKRATVPKRNRAFWVKKFSDNRARDARVQHELRDQGYATFVVWECEAEDDHKLARRMTQILRRLGAAAEQVNRPRRSTRAPRPAGQRPRAP